MNRDLVSDRLPGIVDQWLDKVRGMTGISAGPGPLADSSLRKWMDGFVEMFSECVLDPRRAMVFDYLETLVRRGLFATAPISEIVKGLFSLGEIFEGALADAEPAEDGRALLGRVRAVVMECAVKACRYYDSRMQYQQTRIEDLIEEANIIHLFLDERGRIARINRRGAELLGIEPGEIIGENLGKFVRAGELDHFTQLMGYLLQGIPQVVELGTTFGGVDRDIHITIQPIFDSGKVVGARGIATDVTEGKALQAKLGRSEEKYRKLIENANDAIILTDLKAGAIVDANLRACEFVGAEKDQLIGRPLMELFVKEDEKRVIALLQQTIFEGSSTLDGLRVRRRAGGEIFVETSSNVIEYGETRVIQSALRDISERKKLERKVFERTRELRRAYEELRRYQEDLVKSERIASLGDLAGRLASQLSEPLRQADADLERLAATAADLGLDAQTLRSQLIVVRHTVNHARGVIEDLLSAPHESEAASNLDPNTVIEDNLKLLGHRLIGRIKVRRELEQVPPITASRSVLDQVVFNLLRNGLTSTPDNGRLLIKTYSSGGHVVIEVADSGEGIPDARVHEALDPGFGQVPEGLPNYALARRLTEDHGGSFDLTSRLGYGTQVKVRWPVAAAPSPNLPLVIQGRGTGGS